MKEYFFLTNLNLMDIVGLPIKAWNVLPTLFCFVLFSYYLLVEKINFLDIIWSENHHQTNVISYPYHELLKGLVLKIDTLLL